MPLKEHVEHSSIFINSSPEPVGDPTYDLLASLQELEACGGSYGFRMISYTLRLRLRCE